MSRRIRLILGGVFLVSAFSFGFLILEWRYVVRFPKIISAYYAKEFCSCVFVMELPEDSCHNRVRQWVPISFFKLDRTEMIVQTRGLGFEAEARWVNKIEGCRLY